MSPVGGMLRLPRFAVLTTAASLVIPGCGSDETTGPPPPVAVDSAPPVILRFMGPSEAVNPGTEFEIRFQARDAFGIKRATMIVHGAFADTISGEFEEVPKELEAYAMVHVPYSAPIDVPVIARLTVADEAGHEAYSETRIYLGDTRPPFVSLDLGGLHFDGTIRTGETLELFINAEDNHRLKFIGYEGGGLRDSVASTSVGDSHTFRLTVPDSWAANRPLLKPWARDSSGNIAGNFARHVPVYNWADRAVTTILLLPDENARVLWDAKRGTVYRLRYDPETANSTRIEGVVVSSGTYLPPMTLPRSPHEFTFSGSGDSLVVVFFPEGEPALGIVDLLSPGRSTSIVPLVYDMTLPRGPYAAHAAGGRFFVALMSGLYGARLLDINFGTGTQVIRTDLDGSAEVANYPSLLPLPDGRLVIGPTFSNGQPEPRYVYSPTSNTFTATFRLRPVSSRQYSASPSGRFMMGETVFGAAFDSVTTVATQDWTYYGGAGAFALSNDGQFVYLATLYGYQKVRLSDGLVLEQVKLKEMPLYMFAVADGSKLIAVGASSVMVIELR